MKTIQPTDDQYNRSVNAAQAAVEAASKVTQSADELFFAIGMAAAATISIASKKAGTDPMAAVEALAINIRTHILNKERQKK